MPGIFEEVPDRGCLCAPPQRVVVNQVLPGTSAGPFIGTFFPFFGADGRAMTSIRSCRVLQPTVYRYHERSPLVRSARGRCGTAGLAYDRAGGAGAFNVAIFESLLGGPYSPERPSARAPERPSARAPTSCKRFRPRARSVTRRTSGPDGAGWAAALGASEHLTLAVTVLQYGRAGRGPGPKMTKWSQ
jgi:hypothetical protein